MLMGVDHDGIRLPDRIECRARGRSQVIGQPEVSAVCRIHVDSESVAVAKPQDAGQRIDRAHPCRPKRRNHAANLAL